MSSLETYICRLIEGPPFKRNEEMQYEVLRLASFDKWPYWAVKRPMDLAESGFSYSGDGDRVICFSCNGEISNWTAKDNVKEQHKKRYPSCKFMNGQETQNVEFKVVGEQERRSPIGTDCNGSREGSIEDKYAAANNYEQFPNHNSVSQAFTTAAATAFPAGSTVNNGQSAMKELDKLFDELKSLEPRESSCGDRIDSPTPNVSEPGTGRIDEIDPNFVKHENYRLRTFEGNWPPNSFISPTDLAKAGLYYVASPDKVQCAFCKGRLLNWKPSDCPMGEHRKHFPECPFIQGRNVGNVPSEESASSVQIPQSQRSSIKSRGATSSERLGIILDKPKHPDYAIESNRINSYKTWPKRSTISPEILSKAGFFYVGYSDNVKCFFCDGGLRNWEENDDPWREHARWFSRCGFLKLRMGEDYINGVLDETNATGNSTTTRDVMAPVEKPGSAPPERPLSTMSAREVKARLDTPIIRTVIDMGFDKDLVKKVLEDHFRITGDDFQSAEELLQAVFLQQEVQQRELERQKELQAATAEPQKPTISRRKKRNRKKKKKGGGSEETPEVKESEAAAAAEEPAESDNESETEETTESEAMFFNEDEEYIGLERQYQRIKEERTCKICMDEECTIVFLPCGHLVCCSNCAPALRTCPICRQIIKGSVRMYTT